MNRHERPAGAGSALRPAAHRDAAGGPTTRERASCDPYRIYTEVGPDGYPPEWHDTIKHAVRQQAGHRCVRCHHPYRNGEDGNGEWSRCDENCTHGGPAQMRHDGLAAQLVPADSQTFNAGRQLAYDRSTTCIEPGTGRLLPSLVVLAQWRILTVHHLNGDKADCRWWNLAALCQRCHLTIQGRVQLHRVYPWEHSDWFKPYAAGWYAHAYLGEDLGRDETLARLDELLALERTV